MQRVERVKEIRRETEPSQATPPQAAAFEIHFTWTLLQVIVCALILILLVAAKELLPAQYEAIVSSYQSLMEGDLFTQDRDLIIVGEE